MTKVRPNKRLVLLWAVVACSWPLGYSISAVFRALIHHMSWYDALYSAWRAFVVDGIPTFLMYTVLFILAVSWYRKKRCFITADHTNNHDGSAASC